MKKRISSTLLAICMVLALLPTPALAGGVGPSDIVISYDNKNRVWITIAEQTTPLSGNGWQYEPASKTLTLDGFEGESIRFYEGTEIIDSYTLKLQGTNTLSGNLTFSSGGRTNKSETFAIITGDGSLLANSISSEYMYTVMKSGTITTKGTKNVGLELNGSNCVFHMTGGVLNAIGDNYGIYAQEGAKIILDSGTATAYGSYAAIYYQTSYKPYTPGADRLKFGGRTVVGGEDKSDQQILSAKEIEVKIGDARSQYITALTSRELTPVIKTDGGVYGSLQGLTGAAKYAYISGAPITPSLNPADLAPWAADFDINTEDGVLVKYKGSGGAVTIPDIITSIGPRAFEGCTSLTSVTIPNSVTHIGEYAFYKCADLTGVTIPNSVTTIKYGTFHSCGLTSATIPNSVTTIEHDAFADCKNLTEVTIPNSVISIGYQAFDGCESLTSITIPNSVTNIGGSAFQSCGLTSVTIPASVISIEFQTFTFCKNLTSITIPASVTQIAFGAFGGCNNLKDVYYSGAENQWKQITIEDGNYPLDVIATIHYNSSVPSPTFTDVPNWCADAAKWASGKGIAKGYGDKIFGAGDNCTNAQILTFLWRAAEEPASSAALPVDITGKNISYAETALRWAAEKGMIDSTLNPTAYCTRASAMQYIWQAFDKPSAGASSFVDVSANADYAAAVNWASANGIAAGTGDNKFSPNDVCNRGQIVTFLHRAYVSEVRLTAK